MGSHLFGQVAFFHNPMHFVFHSFLVSLRRKFFDCPSFYAETEQGVAQAIIRSVIDFKRDPWPKVSENAKDLVKRMLDPDPKRRLTAQEVLGNCYFFSPSVLGDCQLSLFLIVVLCYS